MTTKIRAFVLPAIILFAVGLRIALIASGWPYTNSDEGTIGLMARHIAYKGELPIFFYGYDYMGAIEAYVGGALFHLLGASLFTLRFGLILLVSLFLVSMYYLTRVLYTKSWALVTVGLLSLGSSFMLFRELSAFGGRHETILFGSLMFLGACWLALTYDATKPLRLRWPRFLVYGGWGVCVGLGLWSDMLVLPFVATSGLLLLVVCWRELIRGGVLAIIPGLLLGGYPLIYYNLHALPGDDSLSVLINLHKVSGLPVGGYWQTLVKQFAGTFGISLPMMTGSPFCPVSELSFFGPSTPYTPLCAFVQYSWSFGYMLLFVIAIVLALYASWRALRLYRQDAAERQPLVRQSARLLLLSGGLLTLCLYMFSGAPIGWPGIHASYLIGLLVVTPAVFWPLWIGMKRAGERMTGWVRGRHVICIGAFSIVCVLFLLGPIITFWQEVPEDQVKNQQQQALINDLLQRGITHIYTDYWTCNRLAFVTNEQITCVVLGPDLKPTHNREEQYYQVVHADPHAAYVFEKAGSAAYLTAIEKQRANPGRHYRYYEFDGYAVYVPV